MGSAKIEIFGEMIIASKEIFTLEVFYVFLDAACRMQDCGMQDAGCGMRDAGCRMQDAGCGMQDAGCRMTRIK